VLFACGPELLIGKTRTVFDTPAHPYSRGLLDSFPSIRVPRVKLLGIPGSPPDLAKLLTGCRFHPRCPVAMPECVTEEPELYSDAKNASAASPQRAHQTEDGMGGQATWTQAMTDFRGDDEEQPFADLTVRMTVPSSIGRSHVRAELSNRFGDEPVLI
jgi:oligopeptide/dipeptide ABC transporter ATP-binding protein